MIKFIDTAQPKKRMVMQPWLSTCGISKTLKTNVSSAIKTKKIEFSSLRAFVDHCVQKEYNLIISERIADQKQKSEVLN